MAFTLLESPKYGNEILRKGVIKTITQVSPVLDRLKMKTFQGNAYAYESEQTIPSAAYRSVGGTYTPSTGSVKKTTENVVILGGEVKIDNFQIRTEGNVDDIKARQFNLKAKAVAFQFDQSFFEGDSNVTPEEFDGLRKRIPSAQLVDSATNGSTLTIDMIDHLLDLVPFPGSVLYMNRTLRRKFTSLLRAQTGALRIDVTFDSFGKQVVSYDGHDILIVERMDDASSILDFDETCGSSNVTASVYCVAFGDEENVFGLLGAGGSMEVKDFGELEASPNHLGRIEFYPGMTIAHPRAAARLRGITNS